MLKRIGRAIPTRRSGLQDVTDDGFLAATTGGYVFVDFWAPWCVPCRRFAPAFETAAQRYGDKLRFLRCNVDEATETRELLQIQTIPTVVLFDPDGNEVSRVVNPPPGAFVPMVEEVVEERGL